ncbi:hypothetical protein MWU78_06690 [Arenibacter sp. F26102]|uniref:hypothetical protein n=1 Tax=Arenibacter sp. F26102 TaxID=2926416 RepID=UPI001FF1DDD0|nr:hypothetical protein [Arenibacter sp. F26102]MCK0145324.1 hypothetical protein [Arenibacter sp. F26102]
MKSYENIKKESGSKLKKQKKENPSDIISKSFEKKYKCTLSEGQPDNSFWRGSGR